MLYDVYQEQCPSRIVLDLISNKWVILIIESLAEKNHRFGELKRNITGISPKVLSHLLKKLEVFSLIKREDKSDLVLHVEYSLTTLGKSLSTVCEIITDWAENHVDVMLVNHNEPA